jgi:predicted ATPase
MLDDVTGRELSPVFVGRETQLALLQNRLGLVKDGQSGVVLIGGEAGVGKTRLVEEFTREASHAGIDVLWGGCFDLGDDALPFAPFSAALRQPMRAAGVSGLVELAGGDTTDRVRLYEAVADLIEQAGTPDGLVLVLEDLHWSDRSTRELLGFLARTMHDSPVLVVGTYRSDEMHRARFAPASTGRPVRSSGMPAVAALPK